MRLFLLTCLCVCLVLVYVSSVKAGFCRQSYQYKTTCYRQTSYTIGCGMFSWRRCRKTKRVSYSCTRTSYRNVCCKGYTGAKCDIPMCYGSTTCPNGGKCVRPDTCNCLPGYARPKCSVCSSSRLPRVSNGIYRQHPGLPSLATLNCNTGYETKGTGSVVCLSTGSWSASTATCQPKACGQPPKTIAGGKYVVLNGSNIGNQAIVQCNDDHVIQGMPTFIQCQTSGTWSTSSATCVAVCPDGWLEYGNSCYLFGRSELSYTAARKFCQDNKATLAQVDKTAENDFLKQSMEQLGKDDSALEPKFGYWNDAFETTSNGAEVWRETNAALDPKVADWNGKQPDDAGGKQTCTMFWKDFKYEWADIECDAVGKGNRKSDRLGRALCERPKIE